MELQLPQATRNFYVDGHKPTPHWSGVVLQHGALVAVHPSHIGSTELSVYDICGLFHNHWPISTWVQEKNLPVYYIILS